MATEQIRIFQEAFFQYQRTGGGGGARDMGEMVEIRGEKEVLTKEMYNYLVKLILYTRYNLNHVPLNLPLNIFLCR